MRCFCVPGKDKILVCPPTYGMYSVSAQVNDVDVVKVPLFEDFSLDGASVARKLGEDPTIKLAFVCSPGNPTGTLLSLTAIESLLQHPTWNGVVVVDEAYIDFAPSNASAVSLVTKYPNLVVLQTLSKAFGLAGIRLGSAFTSAPIALLLNSMKAPYNVSSTTSALAQLALKGPSLAQMQANKAQIIAQRNRLRDEILKIPGVGRLRGGEGSNFLLVEFLDGPNGKPSNAVALGLYEQLAELEGIVVRFRGKELNCPGCLRITVGTEKETSTLLGKIPVVLQQVWAAQGSA
jgi:histidinol-phosphate aminotransferase